MQKFKKKLRRQRVNSITRTNHFKNYALTYVRTHLNICVDMDTTFQEQLNEFEGSLVLVMFKYWPGNSNIYEDRTI
jgi:hypothetical protein